MWSKVIDVLLKEIDRRRDPKRRLVVALKSLHDALVECHDAYLKYRNHPSYEIVRKYHYHQPDNEYYHFQEQHRNATIELIRRMWKLRDVLPIFAKPVMNELQKYTLSEIERWAPSEYLEFFWKPQDIEARERFYRLQLLLTGCEYQPPLPSATDEEINNDFNRFGRLTAWAWGSPNNRTVTPNYERAIDELRQFIKKHIGPEELL